MKHMDLQLFAVDAKTVKSADLRKCATLILRNVFLLTLAL